MRKFFISFVFLANFLGATTINSIAVVVDKEAITTYDIEQTMKTLNVSRQQALGMLINEKMELSQMRQFGIYSNELELDEAVANILEHNKATLEQLKANLSSKGQSYASFRANLKKDIEKRKLYDKLLSLAKLDYSDDGAKKYFENNPNKFVFYTDIDAYVFKANNEKTLENIKNGKNPAIRSNLVQLSMSNADPRLLGLLSQIPLDNFSPVLNSQNGFELYQIKSKNNPQKVEFEQIKQEVLNSYLNEQRQNYIQDYFEKLRSKINIDFLTPQDS